MLQPAAVSWRCSNQQRRSRWSGSTSTFILNNDGLGRSGAFGLAAALGQNWAANDCHKLSLAECFAWVLLVDFDERLAFAAPEHAAIEAYLQSLAERSQ